MASKYVVDTHALIWFLEGSPKLGSAVRRVLSDPNSELVLPTDQRIQLSPLTLAVLQQSLAAGTVPEMHDRLIVATAMWLRHIGHQVALLTVDKSITAAALTPIIW